LTLKGSKERENCGENDYRRTDPRVGRFRDRTGDWLKHFLTRSGSSDSVLTHCYFISHRVRHFSL